MTNRPVVKNPNTLLREPSVAVTAQELASDEMQTLIDDLIDSMNIENGIGIAAPQIGTHKRVIIVDDGTGAQAFINPVITARSLRKGHYVEEGCLSVPGIWGYVTRNKAVKVKALNRHGQTITLKVENLTSVIFQHEIDHLDGILFIDKVDEYTRQATM
ncbi:peptide deformylase [Candidatus Uhrbacteria bacterium]|nr:peptide deformylase [Candidatus Uhrbacteria bacterium]